MSAGRPVDPTPATQHGQPAGRRRAVRVHRLGLAAWLAAAVLLAACGAPVGSAAPTTAPTPGTGTASPAAPASGVASDARIRLDAALATLADGYRFDTTVGVGGTVATAVTGRVRGGASAMVVTAAGTSVTYVSVPPKAWARQQGGAWTELDATIQGGNPLDALGAPTSVASVPGGADGMTLVATYPASRLGLTGSDPVRVTLVLAADGSLRATYTTPTAGGSADSTTAFSPDPDTSPIVAPIDSPASPTP